jgi:hypothetical protein
MESQERGRGSKWYKQGKDSSSKLAPLSIMWAGCYISCAMFTVVGFLLGGAVGVLISLSFHIMLWLLLALLRFIRFIRTP